MQKKNTAALQTWKTSANKREKYSYPEDLVVKTENEISPDSEEVKGWIEKLHYLDDYEVEKNNKAVKVPLSDEEKKKQRFWKDIEKQALTSDEYEKLVENGEFVSYDQLSKPYHKSLDYLIEDGNGDYMESPLLLEVNQAIQPETDLGRELVDEIVATLDEESQKLYGLILLQKKDVEIAEILHLNKSTVGRRKRVLVKKIQKKL
jgi:hypothetical protein